MTFSWSKTHHSINRKAQYSFVTELCISSQIVRLKPTVKFVHVNNWKLYFIFRMVLSMRGFIVIPFQFSFGYASRKSIENQRGLKLCGALQIHTHTDSVSLLGLCKVKVHPCAGTEALYRSYRPIGGAEV